MGALRNVRREKFCQALIKSANGGLSYVEAYRVAGYTGEGRVAYSNASRLMTFADVRRRMSELLAPAAQKSQISVEVLLSELEITIGDARSAKQHGVVVRALELAAKLVGLLKERVEVTHNEFCGLRSADEVLAMIREELGDQAADAIAAAVVKPVGADTLPPTEEKAE